jgi:hypothetical protein
MRAGPLRLVLIGSLVVAATLGVVGRKTGSPFLNWLSFAFFLGAVFAHTAWRREMQRVRRGTVFDRETQTPDETRARPDE